MSVKIGDTVNLHVAAGSEPVQAIVKEVHESGAIDATLKSGNVAYVLAGNFDVVADEVEKPAVPAVAAPAVHKTETVTHLGKYTTIRR